MNQVASPRTEQVQSAIGSENAIASHGSTAIVAVFKTAAPRPVDAAEVVAAEKLLAELPLESLPALKGLPQGSVIPWPRNRFFVGREPDLLQLARQIKEGGTGAVGQSPAVTGMGGQGKTQLAVEFAYRFGRWFKGGVFWVNCGDPAAIPESIAACGPSLYANEAGFSARPLPERVALVASAWAGPLPRLLIFDNCEDEALVEIWGPKSDGCRLLLTARRSIWSPERGINAVSLGRLSRSESVALLCRHRSDLKPDDPGLAAIAEELGDLPLALELAGSYLARYRHEPIGTPEGYLAELRSVDVLAHASLTIHDPQAQDQPRLLTGHERDVARTFEVSLRRLRLDDRVDALACTMFARAAWLVPGVPIPRHLLKLCVGLAPQDAEAARRFTDALDRLLGLALVESAGEGSGAIVLHRLVATFARSRIAHAEAGNARRAVEQALAEQANHLIPRNDPTPFRDWAAHLLGAAEAAKRDRRTSVGLLNAAGYYSMMMADYDASVALFEYATEQAQAVLGPEHPLVATTLGNLGNAQRQCSDLSGAETSQRRALAIEEKVYGPIHAEVASTLGNLGIVQLERGDLAGAEASQTRALAIEEKVYGPEHPEVARTLDNLGVVRLKCGDLAGAQANLTRALVIQEAVYPPNSHPEIAQTLRHLGQVQRELGEPSDAETHLRRALLINENVYGSDHPDVAGALVDVGNVQRDLGLFSDARESYARAAAIFATRLGEQHPNTVQARRVLSEL